MRAIVLMQVVLAASALAARDDTAANDLNKLAGTWVAESRESEGRVEANADLKGLRLVVAGDKFTLKLDDGRVVLAGTLAVGPAGTPKAVDVKVAGPDGKEVVIPAIYELDGDTLRTAVPQTGGGRPKEFSAKAGSDVRVTVYKRGKE
jgi:uncharacterized protein (TIGR03067 family)